MTRFGVGAVLRDAPHVVEELVFGIGAEVGDREFFLGQIRNEGLDVLDAVKGGADVAGREG